MDIKERMVELINSLKSKGINRRTIEQDLVLGERYLDQALSKGSNPTLLKKLEKYNIAKSNGSLEKTTDLIKHEGTVGEQVGKLNEDIIRLSAAVNVLLVHVAETSSFLSKKALLDELGELQKQVSDEIRRLRGEYTSK